MLPGSGFIYGSGSSGVPAITGTDFPDATNSSTDGVVYSYASQSLGTPTSETYLAVFVTFNKNKSRWVNSVTIGGDNLTPVVSVSSSSGILTGGALFFKKIGTDYGTSATIEVTYNGGVSSSKIGVAVFNKTGTVTATDTIGSNGNGVTSVSSTIDAPANGVVIGAYAYDGSTGTPTFSAGLTDDSTLLTGEHETVYGFTEFTTADAGRTITGSGQSGSEDAVLIVGAFQ